MFSIDSLSDGPCHSKRMYLNFVQYAVIDHNVSVLLFLFVSLFIATFFIVIFARFYSSCFDSLRYGALFCFYF